MIDKKNVSKGLEETKIMLTQAVDRGGEMSVYGAYKCLNNVTDAIALLKEQKEEAQATPQPHPCKECNKYGCDVHCPYYGK